MAAVGQQIAGLCVEPSLRPDHGAHASSGWGLADRGLAATGLTPETVDDETAWTPIRYARAVWDDDEGRYIFDAQIARIAYTALTGRHTAEQITGRLLVRRVRRLNPASVPHGLRRAVRGPPLPRGVH